MKESNHLFLTFYKRQKQTKTNSSPAFSSLDSLPTFDFIVTLFFFIIIISLLGKKNAALQRQMDSEMAADIFLI